MLWQGSTDCGGIAPLYGDADALAKESIN